MSVKMIECKKDIFVRNHLSTKIEKKGSDVLYLIAFTVHGPLVLDYYYSFIIDWR